MCNSYIRTATVQPRKARALGTPSKQPSNRSSCIWRVNNRDLPIIPHNYPLELSHIVISGTTAPVLSGRISEFMRLYSLAPVHDQQNKHSIQCTTESSLLLEINLWKKNNDHDDVIVVELRKRSGCSIEFRRVRCLFFKAILQSKHKLIERQIKQSFSHDKQYISKQARDRRPSPAELRSVLQSAQMACGLIQTTNSTQDIMTGLRMLAFLTDPHKINLMFASGVASMLLTGVTILGKKTDARDALYNHALSNDAGSIIHQFSIKIIANCLQLVRQTKNRAVLTDNDTLSIWANIVPTLIQDMENVNGDSNGNAHISCVAMRCLRELCTMQRSYTHVFGGDSNICNDMNMITNKIAKTWYYGKVHSVALEREAQELMKALNPAIATYA